MSSLIKASRLNRELDGKNFELSDLKCFELEDDLTTGTEAIKI